MLSALVLVAVALPADPRPPLVELEMAGRNRDALVRVEREIAAHPDAASRFGLSYLRGHLLESLGERRAVEAFARAIVETPALGAYGRYRLALGQVRSGHPEVAAGLLAGVVAGEPRSPLLPRAVRLFQKNLRGGGDCRLLQGIRLGALPVSERRALTIARADCALRSGELELARALLAGVLEESSADEWALPAARSLAGLDGVPRGRPALLTGLVLAAGQEIELALGALRRAALAGPRRDRAEAAASIGRVQLAAGRYSQAIAQLEASVREAPTPAARARSRAEQARAFERLGQWRSSAARFLEAAALDPEGAGAASALAGALRLEARGGNDAAAGHLLARLAERPAWRQEAARAALFLAASDLVRGRPDRAREWLSGPAAAADALELAYWRGRLAEAARKPDEAVAAYLSVLRADPYHLLAEGARRRLADPVLAPKAMLAAEKLAASGRLSDLSGAWLLAGDASPLGRSVKARLAKKLAADREAAPYLRLSRAAVASWPLWSRANAGPEALLLALGIWIEGGPAVPELFPKTSPDLAFTASLELARVGQIQRSILLAEALRASAPKRVPWALEPPALRALVYPFPYSDLVRAEGARRGVAPLLLVAFLREESLFDPAFARGVERGLAGLIPAAASRIAAAAGLPPPGPDDLERPEVAIPLAAVELGAELRTARGAVHRALAAVIAGSETAKLWQSYCFSQEPEELWTKMTDGAARARLAAVFATWAHYREEYEKRP